MRVKYFTASLAIFGKQCINKRGSRCTPLGRLADQRAVPGVLRADATRTECRVVLHGADSRGERRVYLSRRYEYES